MAQTRYLQDPATDGNQLTVADQKPIARTRRVMVKYAKRYWRVLTNPRLHRYRCICHRRQPVTRYCKLRVIYSSFLHSRDAAQHRFRLAIDRAFTVKGATGGDRTALSGEVNVGDTLWLTGVTTPMRVRPTRAKSAHRPCVCRAAYALNIARCGERSSLTAATGCFPMRRRGRLFSRVIVFF